MLVGDSKERVKELCDQIAKEQDRNRFSELISELNQLLEKTGSKNGSDGTITPSVNNPS